MGETAYEVLGVERTASVDEIRARYHELAMRYHPDRNADAPEHLKGQLSEMMAQLNDAWSQLSDPARRAEYDRSLAPRNRPAARQTRPSVRGRPPRHDECALCGSSPAVEVTLRQASGFILRWTRRSMTAVLCRDCGTAEFRLLQNRTLYTGWWGLISFFVNLSYVLSNIGAAMQLRRLGVPNREERIDVPLDQPLDVGSPLLARGGVWLATALFVGLAALLALGGSGPKASTTGTSSSSATWQVGSCVQGTTSVEPVACSQTHAGKIVAIETSPNDCPPSDAYAEDQTTNTVYCVDTTQ